MDSKIIANGILRAVATMLGVALLAFFFYQIRSVMAYVVIAAVTALIGRPLVYLLNRKLKLPKTLAVVITMFAFVAVLMGIIALFIPLLSEQSKNLSLLNIDGLQGNIENLYHQFIQYFNLERVNFQKNLQESTVFSKLDFGFIPEFLNSFVSSLSSLSMGLFSVLFISFFFLKDNKLIENSLLTLIPDRKERGLKHSLKKINYLLSRYFVGLMIQILVLFIIYTAVLLIVGIENAVVIAFLCALFNIIPYVGPLLGGALMIMLTMTSNLGMDFSTVILPKAIYVLIGLGVGQLVDNFVSQPLIFSTSVKSHPLEIFLVIIIAGILFGVVGMIAAVPGYTALKVILKEFLSDNKMVRSLTRNL